MPIDLDPAIASLIHRQAVARSRALSGSSPMLTTDDLGRDQRTGMTAVVVKSRERNPWHSLDGTFMDPMNTWDARGDSGFTNRVYEKPDIVAIATHAAENGQRVRLTTADGASHEGVAGRAQGSSAAQFGLRDAGGLIRCFSTSPNMGDDRRVVGIEVLPAEQDSKWIEVTSIEQARALNGKMVEVDTTQMKHPGALAQFSGSRVRAHLFGKNAMSVSDYEIQVIAFIGGEAPSGLRLRVVEAKPRIIGGVPFSCPTQVPVSVMISGYKVDLIACQRALFGWTMSLSPGVDVDADQIKAAVQSTMDNAIVAVSKDGETWLRSVAITAREVASISLDRVKIFDHERRDLSPRAMSLRPELAAAIARQEQAEQPPQSVTCPRCKGHGTELLVSPCPQCSGTGSLTVISEDRRYSYELRETFRDGDQVWAIKYGDSLGSSVDSYVMTSLVTSTEPQHVGALATEVYPCSRSGKVLANWCGTRPGSFIGEHHGERAVSGYVDWLNATSGC